jgi:uncharacterized membrane protein
MLLAARKSLHANIGRMSAVLSPRDKAALSDGLKHLPPPSPAILERVSISHCIAL